MKPETFNQNLIEMLFFVVGMCTILFLVGGGTVENLKKECEKRGAIYIFQC